MNALPAHLLTRGPHRPDDAPAVTLDGDLPLVLGRVHELCGLSRRVLALAIAARLTGPVIWIAPDRANVMPNPDGYARWLAPGRLIHVNAGPDRDVLWAAEEVLRCGAAPVMIADLPDPPTLTAVRRMHLAAESGAVLAQRPPIGLLMTPDGGSPGVETRWKITPDFTAGQARWILDRQRARTAPPLLRRVDAIRLMGRPVPEPAIV